MNLWDYFGRCYIINLDRRPDRWKQCLEEIQLNGLPMEWIERVPAVDNPENGNAGCTQSHRDLIRRIADGEHEQVLVLEDDFEAIRTQTLLYAGFRFGSKVLDTHSRVLGGGGNLNERFHAMRAYLPGTFDVLYLGAGYGEPPISRINPYVVRCGAMLTTGSYGIWKDFAKTWTERVDAMPALGPIDSIFGLLAKDSLYYCLQPRLIYQRFSKSDLNGQENTYLMSMTDPYHENLV